jgi:hypothetical protein
MKFVRTVVVFDRGNLLPSEQWAEAYLAYTRAIRKVVHPPGNDKFLIRRRTRKLDAQGRITTQWNRNGVVPIRNQFFEQLSKSGWQTERPVGLEHNIGHPGAVRSQASIRLKEYPSLRSYQLEDADWANVFHQKVGDFDFYAELSGGLRCVIEWETGNISSSHRSMNKLCLIMMAGLIEVGIVILPSRDLYTHLTDRIGNWMELSPYLALWQQIGQGIDRGLLAVTVVEQDELTDDPTVPYIQQGSDGRSAEGAAKLL